MPMSEQLGLPPPAEVRRRIDAVEDDGIRNCFRTAYLYAGRISEVVGAGYFADIPRGPKGSDVRMESYELGPIKEPAVVFTVRTAKREGKPRLVGLPVNYEPWALPLYDYFQEHGDDFIFPFTRQVAWEAAKKTFDGLSYTIEPYHWHRQGGTVVVERHLKPFTDHALRHLRASELVEFYGFDGVDLGIYGGWTLRTAARMPTMVDRYLELGWQRYFPKLLKKARDTMTP